MHGSASVEMPWSIRLGIIYKTLAPRWVRLRSVCVGRVMRRRQAPGERGFANPSR